jgi:hypothetical protein
MTGLVKEEIIARLAELALTAEDGCLVFDPILFDREELLREPATFEYLDVAGAPNTVDVPVGAMAYTCCQTPIILQSGEKAQITVHTRDGGVQTEAGLRLDAETTRHIFERDGQVEKLVVQVLPGV